MKRLLRNTALAVIIAVAPTAAFAQGHGHGYGHDRGHDRGEHQKEHREQHHAPPPHVNHPIVVHYAPPSHVRHDEGWRRREEDEKRRREIEWRRYHPPSAGYVYHERQVTKNEWRNLAIASGLIGVIGLLEHDKTLVFAGSAGALYSLYRYEEDRKSQSSLARARAFYFSHPYFVRNGQRYDRRLVVHHGQRYYQFVRG
ncbi:MAG TPA: hypothetical protein VHE55_09575 [Fimbriimonadaceae bacterium]|nr:hypothetical protein [Fimbriimonadaceae bacterium]